MTDRTSRQTWISLGRARLHLVGARASGLERLWSGASWVGLAAGVAWFAQAWLRPIDEPDPVTPGPIKLLELPARVAAPIDHRYVALEALWLKNRFAADGLPWPRVVQRSERKVAPGQESGLSIQMVTSTEIGMPVATTLVKQRAEEVVSEELPAKVKSALALLELRGVYIEHGVAPVAMIGFGPTLGIGSVQKLREGEAFAGPSEKESLWRVESIDVTSKEVVLSREGVRAEISMYALSGEPVEIESDSIPSVPIVATASEDEILQALLDAGVSAEDLTLLTKLMRAPTLPVEVEQEQVTANAGRALTEVIAASPEAPARAGPPQMPTAMRELLEQMAAQSAGSNRNRGRGAVASGGESE